MEDLNRTLNELAAVRGHLARGAYYRGYRASMVLLTGAVALAAMRLQPLLVPPGQPRLFVAFWVTVAAVNMAVAALAALAITRARGAAFARQQTVSVFGAAMATVMAGAAVTAGLVVARPDGIVFLLGFWCLLFAIGIFATLPFLPRAVGWSGVWYFACGVALLVTADSGLPLSPLGMGVSFGTGQALCALLLYLFLEKNGHDEEN